jgi:hypothetical protein
MKERTHVQVEGFVLRRRDVRRPLTAAPDRTGLPTEVFAWGAQHFGGRSCFGDFGSDLSTE